MLSHLPTGVVVVTGADRSSGMTVGSFTSISLRPPLVGFFCDRESTSWPRIRAAGAFCANVLGSGQGELAAQFARQGGDKIAGVPHRLAPVSGSPLLAGILAWVDCRVEREVEVGDHILVVGAALGLGVAGSGGPLLFFRGDYPALHCGD